MALPLTLPTYYLDGTASIVTTIVSNYNTAQCSFQASGTQIYLVTLTQATPVQQLPPNLVLGTYTIVSGTLTLTTPGNFSPGFVTLNCTYTDTTVPSGKLNAMIATWNLNQ